MLTFCPCVCRLCESLSLFYPLGGRGFRSDINSSPQTGLQPLRTPPFGETAGRPQLSFTAYLARLQRAMVPGLILGVDGAKPPPADSAVAAGLPFVFSQGGPTLP